MLSSESAWRNAVRVPLSSDSWAKAFSAAASDFAFPVVATSSATSEATPQQSKREQTE